MKMNRKLLGITGVFALAISLIAVGSITVLGEGQKETAQSPLLEYRLNEAAEAMGFYTQKIDWEYETIESGIYGVPIGEDLVCGTEPSDGRYMGDSIHLCEPTDRTCGLCAPTSTCAPTVITCEPTCWYTCGLC